jgi:hypothetical protein
MVLRSLAAMLAIGGLFTVGCGGVTDPSKNTTETISGVVEPGGNFHKPVEVNNRGEYSVKITGLSPTPTAVLGLRFFQGGNCDFLLSESFAGLNSPALSGAVLQKGAHCVLVWDLGTLTVAQNVTLTVSHP